MKHKKLSLYMVISHIILFLFAFCIIMPFLLVFSSSLTEESVLMTEGYNFWPKKLSLTAYEYLFSSNSTILRAYGVSAIVSVAGTLMNVLLSSMMAYPLSRPRLPGGKILLFFVFFTMLFNGGLVPSYIVWTKMIGVKDTIWAQLLPNLFVGSWNVLMIRNYFQNNIPVSLYEAAELDGATPASTLRHITLPLSKPILITVGSFSFLGYWNDWTNGLYYISKRTELYNVQNLLNKMVQNAEFLSTAKGGTSTLSGTIPSTAVQMAIAFVAILPLLLLFPFFQKYYTKGITLGAVKG